MSYLRTSRSLVLPALLSVAALFALALERLDGFRQVLATEEVGSLAGVVMGLAVAALVLSRISARR